MAERMTSAEWCERLGTVVLDPDGWDRSSPEAFEASWTERITEAEFIERWPQSTVRSRYFGSAPATEGTDR